MSSAIEILKEMQHFWFEGIELNKRNGDETSFKDFQELNALGEAIVALEKQEKLKEWLEKEINLSEDRLANAMVNGNNKLQSNSMIRIKSLKEVLGKVGEQK